MSMLRIDFPDPSGYHSSWGGFFRKSLPVLLSSAATFPPVPFQRVLPDRLARNDAEYSENATGNSVAKRDFRQQKIDGVESAITGCPIVPKMQAARYTGWRST